LLNRFVSKKLGFAVLKQSIWNFYCSHFCSTEFLAKIHLCHFLSVKSFLACLVAALGPLACISYQSSALKPSENAALGFVCEASDMA